MKKPSFAKKVVLHSEEREGMTTYLTCPACDKRIAPSLGDLVSHDYRKAFRVCDFCDRPTCLDKICLQPDPHSLRPRQQIRCKACMAVKIACVPCFVHAVPAPGETEDGGRLAYKIDACVSCVLAARARGD
jgi:hypothetical protein